MFDLKNLTRVQEYLWEIPPSFRADMKVPACLFASEKLLPEIARDRSLEQLINVTTLPGIVPAAYAMPDLHEGYGFPIGGVAATRLPDGFISPGGIGYDINCGMRLLKTTLTLKELQTHLPTLADKLAAAIPSGVGRGGKYKFNTRELDQILAHGVPYLIEKGFGAREDLDCLESGGVLSSAEAAAVSPHAKARGQPQLGTLGAGNHFVEVGRVADVFDKATAAAFGLFPEQIVILIHTGSRGLGHQVATDYIRLMLQNLARHQINLPDRELAGAPLSSPEGQQYFQAMAAAANFAWANRQLLTYRVRQVWQDFFGSAGGSLTLLYDVAHNIAKIEEHEVSNISNVSNVSNASNTRNKKRLLVHRKGATRAFPPHHPELTPQFQSTGQPVIIPGSMGTASYVLVGAAAAMQQSFGSTCHGAGRRMSRHQAQREVRGATLKKELEKKGVTVRAGSLQGLAEEAPFAYKDIEAVVEVVHQAGLAKKVARLRPVAVIKG